MTAIKIINYISLFDELNYYELDKQVYLVPSIYKLSTLKEVFVYQLEINDFSILDIFVCQDNLEPFIFNSIKLNEKDNIQIDSTGRIFLLKSNLPKIILSNQIVIRFQNNLKINNNKIERKQQVSKLTDFEKIIYDYHPNRSNLSRYPLLILSRL